MEPPHGFILVVDDNENNRDLLRRQLERQAHRVAMAEDGVEALEMCRAQPFDLILLDLAMPKMNGYQVLEHLKADPGLRHIPVIIVSAVDELESVAHCIELGAEDYLIKPFNRVLLQARTNACLEKKRLRDKEQAYLQAIQQELEIGRRIQADFLPVQLPQLPGWEVAAFFQPARQVAGDFYDTFVLPGERLGLVIADVCDKGVGAALFMALTRSLLRAFAEQAAATTTGILNAVALTNNYIIRHHRHSRTYMFATLFFGVLDVGSGVLTYINAGHYPPIITSPSGSKLFLEPTGPAVGLARDLDFGISRTTFEPGDLLLAYTDGLTEAFNPDGDFFSEGRLLTVLMPPIPSANTVLDRIESSVRDHVAQGKLADDITLLAVRRLLAE
ncbi:MAG: PP2C family protein-serine/threonine phosphatase [Anaerolineae bacterium]